MIQLIGIRKDPGTRKAERFFKERGVKFHFVDLLERPLSPGELENISAEIDPEDLIDRDSKEYKKRGMQYMDFNILEELLEHPLLLRLPIVRSGRKAIAGVNTELWLKWIKEEKQ